MRRDRIASPPYELPGGSALRGLERSTSSGPHSGGPDVSVVLPCLNEVESLAALTGQIEAAMAGTRYEVVFVDDGSRDATWRIIRSRLHAHPHWQALRLTRRFGHQAALLAGMSVARGGAVITMDADGQHPPRLLPDMIRAWCEGAKVVQMIREPSGKEPWLKRVTSRWFYRAFSILCDVPVSQAAADFRLLDREVVGTILRMGGPAPFLRGLIPWLGWPTTEVSYTAEARLAGTTKYSLGRMVRLAIDGLMSFSIVPLRLAIWVGLIVAGLSFAYLCFILGARLVYQGIVPGWASIAGLMALLGGVQLFCTGLLGEYIGRLYVGTLDRPRFVVREAIRPQHQSEEAAHLLATAERILRDLPLVPDEEPVDVR